MTKKSLSEKKVCVGDITLGKLNEKLSYYVYKEKDLKHDIKRLQEALKEINKEHIIAYPVVLERIEKIFGKELTGGTQDD